MLCPACYHDAVRFGGDKLHGVADVVAPESCIAVDDERVVLPHLHIFERESCWILVEDLSSGNEFEEDAAVGVEQQSFCFLRILECEESFGCGEGLNAINLSTDAIQQPGFIWFEVHAAVNQHREMREYFTYLFSCAVDDLVEIHLHPGWNAADE